MPEPMPQATPPAPVEPARSTGPVEPVANVRALWQRGVPLRRLRSRRRRFASACFLFAGLAFGTSLYLLRTRFLKVSGPTELPIFVGLVALMVALFVLGASAEGEVSRIDEQLQELEEQMGIALRRRD